METAESVCGVAGNDDGRLSSKGLQIKAVVELSENNPMMRAAVKTELRAREPRQKFSLVESDDFHECFRVADHAQKHLANQDRSADSLH